MGLGKWLARKGNIGGTARSVAKLYHHYKKTYQTDNLKFIIALIIEHRYERKHNPLMKDLEGKKETLANWVKNDRIDSISSLVISILIVETSYGNVPNNIRATFRSIVYEELDKLGVPGEHIFGN